MYRSEDGVDGDEDPPVPMPNTEVKLISVENTWLATAREDRAMPSFTKPIGDSDGFFLCPEFWIRSKPKSFPQSFGVGWKSGRDKKRPFIKAKNGTMLQHRAVFA